MSDAAKELAASLEEYGTSRANFRESEIAELYRIARWLVIARSQVNASRAPDVKCEGNYGRELRKKKTRYFHACGRAGISVKEATVIWWNAVYDGAAPVERVNLV